MAVLKCKMCGGDLNIQEGLTVAECEYCGSKQTVPTADNEKKLTLFARANRLRAACEFDKAAGVYESIVAEFPEEAEGYWGLLLCRFGIEYVDDPATGKKIPTCHRSSFDSVMDDSDFEQVMENADAIARRVYRDEAKAIEELRKRIIEVSSKEEPYDIFICYKETGENGERTIDSVIAQDVYDALTEKGYKVFFSRITLEDKLGVEYEPYIFAALNSAKIMLAFGTDYEYYNAVWVKNEWSRFLALIAKGEKKTLIPCYKGIDAYDMPKEFAKLQAQDMGKVGAMQDLLRGIGKILPKNGDKPAEAAVQPVVQQVVQQVVQSGPGVESLLKRAFMYLEDGEWESADGYCEKVLDQDPENAEAYLGKLLAKLHLRSESAIGSLDQDAQISALKSNVYYAKFNRFAIPERIQLFESLVAKAETSAVERKQREAAIRVEQLRLCAAKREKIATAQNLIAAGYSYTVGLKSNGTLAVVGSDYGGQCDISSWTDIGMIVCGNSHTVGLKSDGTVVAAGDNSKGQCNVDSWNKIVAIAAGLNHTVGLKEDGKVIATKLAWDQKYNKGQCDVYDWKEIVAIAAGFSHTVGLKNDGTVVVVGSIDQCEVDGWKEIVVIASGSIHTVGLKADGTVVATGSNGYGQCNVDGWKEIVAIAAGPHHTVGLKADGTVVATKYTGDKGDYHGQCDVNNWKEIVAIAAGWDHTVGLKSDGTVVATRFTGEYYNGQCDVDDWKLFNDLETITQERNKAAERAEQERLAAKQRMKDATERKRGELLRERREMIADYQKARAFAESELANLKGAFSGIRRKKLEAEIAKFDWMIGHLQKELADLQK